MKVPFFYLTVDGLSVFQPHNRNRGINKYKGSVSIKAVSNPDCAIYEDNGGTLYLNGDDHSRDFNICTCSFKIDKAIELLKTIEVNDV